MNLDRLVSWGTLLDPRPPARRRLEAFQDARLCRLVRHAYFTVPWYRAKLDRLGVLPETIRGRTDLEVLPCVTKEELRAAGETALSRDFAGGRLVRRQTSGSSGLPMTVTFSPGEERMLMVLRLLILFRLGLRPHHRIATIWPPQRTGRLSWVLRWAQGVRLFRFHEIDVKADHREIARRLLEIRPHILIGYPNILCLAAAELTAAGRTWSPHMVLAGGETLTAGARRFLEKVFGCEVTELYGCHELNLIAWQCRHSGLLHVCEEGVLVEVLREDNTPAAEGEAGELVGTALHSFAQPLLRYRLGDVVTRGPQPCPCGLPYATLAGIRGRRVDRLMLPDGGSISGLHLLDEVGRTQSWVRQYRLVQEDQRHVVLQLVPLRRPCCEELASLQALVSAQLAPTFEWRIEQVDSLPAGCDGKFRLVESRVQRNFD
jgi:phenylacetate-CoA ligase